MSSNVVNAAATIFIGAKLGSGFQSIFKSAEKAGLRLGQVYRDTNKKLATANDVAKYGALLKELHAKQSAAGGSSKALAEGIKNVEALYRKAKKEAKGYGLEVGNIAREQQRLSLKSKLAGFGARNIGVTTRLLSGAAGVGAALFAGAVDKAKDAQALSNQAKLMGINIQKFQEYRGAAEIMGIDQDKFTDSLQKQAIKMSEAARGTGTAGKTLNKLGLDAQFLSNLSPEKQFDLISDGLQKVTNQNDRLAMAKEIWGDSGVEMLNMAELGSKGIAELRDTVRATGVVMDESGIQQSKEFAQQLSTVTLQLRGIKDGIVVGAMPAFAGLLSAVIPVVSLVGKAINFFGGFKAILLGIAAYALPGLIGLLPLVAGGIMAIGTALAANPLGAFLATIGLVIANWERIQKWWDGGKKDEVPTADGAEGAAVKAAMSVPVARGGSSVVTTTHAPITIHASPGMDEKQLAMHVRHELDERDRKTARARRGAHYD